MKFLTKEHLESLSTPRLIAYKRKLNRVYYYTNGGDAWDGNEPTKEEQEIKDYFSMVKSILSKRENLNPKRIYEKDLPKEVERV